MLNKNIYIVYLPGYSGSYLNWCLSKSENDLKDTTIDNPINNSSSNLYGGEGTSHLHHRIPTHASIRELAYWIILNKPVENKIYLVNAWSADIWAVTVDYIMNMDRDPVIIHITAADADSRAVGNINGLTKWPLYFYIRNLHKLLSIDSLETDFSDHARNSYVRWYDECFPYSLPVNFDESIYSNVRETYSHWYNFRNQYNPHEVNGQLYIEPYKKPKHYYNIHLMDIYKKDFITLLKNIIVQTDSGNYNFDYVEQFHPKYVEAQQHVRYIDEINKFREDKVLTEYLCSHPLIQALVIKDIKNQLPADYQWENDSIQQIVNIHKQFALIV